RATAAVQQSELDETLSRPPRADDLLPAVLRLLVALGAPREDDIELVGSVPLKEHHGVRLEALSPGDTAELFELSGAGPLEDGNLRELPHIRSRRCVRLLLEDANRRRTIARSARKASTAVAARCRRSSRRRSASRGAA